MKLKLFPLEDHTKEPRKGMTRPWEHATDGPHDFTENNWGMPMGKEFGRFAVDIDPRHDGHMTKLKLEVERGVFTPTRRVKTPRGGEHLVYAHFDVPDPRGICSKQDALGPGIDIVGWHGYIVAPPSWLGAGAGGGKYKLVDDLPLAEAPSWLKKLIIDLNSTPANSPRFASVNPSGSGQGWTEPVLLACLQFLKSLGFGFEFRRVGEVYWVTCPGWTDEGWFPSGERHPHQGPRLSNKSICWLDAAGNSCFRCMHEPSCAGENRKSWRHFLSSWDPAGRFDLTDWTIKELCK